LTPDNPFVRDPLRFARHFWPDGFSRINGQPRWFWNKQIEILQSVVHNVETYCVAGNKLGKDFVAGFIPIWFFCTREPCRVVLTSATERHLGVLEGEMGRFLASAKAPNGGGLLAEKNGGVGLEVKFHEVTWAGEQRPRFSYIKSLVAGPDTEEAMGGHHVAQFGDGVPRTLFIGDEASAIPTGHYEKARPWFNRGLFIGNAWPTNNFFRWAFHGRPGSEDRGGDILADV
jgi:hypothetical protein